MSARAAQQTHARPAADLDGRRCVVTGATHGIGRATAEALAARGAAVVVHGRDAAAVAAVCGAIAQSTGNRAITGAVADFGSLADVRRLAGELAADRIDVLVNNVGTMTNKRKTTADGFERQFGVNHLAPFLLTHLLMDTLRRSAPARIVNVASEAHRRARIDFEDLQCERTAYQGLRVYGMTKLANMLFTLELAHRLAGTGVTANCLHPGVVATHIANDLGVGGVIFRLIGRLLLLSPKDGAATSVYLAASPEVSGVTGKYFDRCRERAPAPAALDAAAAARLWDVSERLVGLRS
ncbi:MAG TPA: SDR family oxidoreductase [Gammaproteobacteria bacterium]|nr:SDR family oxidoreductase [Gammaproteobacteria bacterium]